MKIDDLIICSTIFALVGLLIYRHWGTKPEMGTAAQGIGVSSLIKQVKEELETVDRERMNKGETALFLVERFDLELNFVVKESHSAEGKIEYKIFTVGGREEYSAEKTQKITLHLKTAPERVGAVKPDPSLDEK